VRYGARVIMHFVVPGSTRILYLYTSFYSSI